MGAEDNFKKIFDKGENLSQTDKDWIKGELNSRIDLFFDNKKAFWQRMKGAPQSAFNQIIQLQIKDVYEKILLKDEDSSIIMDLFFAFVLGPLAGAILSELFEKAIGSQFFSRLFTTKIKPGTDPAAFEKIYLEVQDLAKINKEVAKKEFGQNFGKMLNKGEPNNDVRKKIMEFGKDAMKDGGAELPKIIQGAAKKGPTTEASSEINIATAISEFEAYSQHQIDFFTDLSRGLKAWLNDMYYDYSDKNADLSQNLKFLKDILDISKNYLLDELTMDKAKDDYALFLEAIYWSIIYNGRIFTYPGVVYSDKGPFGPLIPQTSNSAENYYNPDPNSLTITEIEPAVGKPIFDRLVNFFPHNGYKAGDKKFKDYLELYPIQVVNQMMDQYFSTLYFAVANRNILALIKQSVDKAKGFLYNTASMAAQGLFTGK